MRVDRLIEPELRDLETRLAALPYADQGLVLCIATIRWMPGYSQASANVTCAIFREFGSVSRAHTASVVGGARSIVITTRASYQQDPQ